MNPFTFPTALRRAVSTAAVAATLMVPLFAHAADEFEGRVRMKVSQGEIEQGLDYFVKQERMRIVPDHSGATGQEIILNMKDKQVLMLMPDQKVYMVMPVPDIADDAEDEEQKRPEPQEETREILGHQARKYTFEAGGADYEIWATDELGKLGGLSLGGAQPRSAAVQAVAQEDFFPLLIIERRNGEVTSRVEVQEVEEERLPDSLFEPPADYQKMDSPFSPSQQ